MDLRLWQRSYSSVAKVQWANCSTVLCFVESTNFGRLADEMSFRTVTRSQKNKLKLILQRIVPSIQHSLRGFATCSGTRIWEVQGSTCCILESRAAKCWGFKWHGNVQRNQFRSDVFGRIFPPEPGQGWGCLGHHHSWSTCRMQSGKRPRWKN